MIDYYGVCADAAFNVFGHDALGESVLSVDEVLSNPLTFEKVADRRSAFILTKDWTAKLATGSVASLVTSKGTVHFSLHGSKEAFDAARSECLRRIVQPLEAQPQGFIEL